MQKNIRFKDLTPFQKRWLAEIIKSGVKEKHRNPPGALTMVDSAHVTDQTRQDWVYPTFVTSNGKDVGDDEDFIVIPKDYSVIKREYKREYDE